MPSAPSVAAIGRPLVCAASPGRGTVIVSPDRHFFAAQSASGRRELLAAMPVDLGVHHHYVRVCIFGTHRREYGSVEPFSGVAQPSFRDRSIWRTTDRSSKGATSV